MICLQLICLPLFPGNRVEEVVFETRMQDFAYESIRIGP